MINFEANGKKVELGGLSDGEHQILSIYCLLDLFDSENTIFLLDEVDSHIHPKSIYPFWKVLKESKGYLLASTHNVVSMARQNVNFLYFFDDGLIVNDIRKKSNVLEMIHGNYFFNHVSCSMFLQSKKLVLIDDVNDWIIFIELMRSLGKNVEELENDFCVFGVPSGFTTGMAAKEIGNLKEDWVNLFMHTIQHHISEDADVNLEKIFLICDKDDFPHDALINNNTKNYNIPLGKTKNINVIKKKNFKLDKIVWNRRYIESYLLSPTALREYTHLFNGLEEDVLKRKFVKFPNDLPKENLKEHIVNLICEMPGVYITKEEDLNETMLRESHCKKKVRYIYGEKGEGLNIGKLREYISKMDDAEKDPYLEMVYNYLVG